MTGPQDAQHSPSRGLELGQLALVLVGLGGLYLTSLHSYLLFHSLAEMFSVVVACAVFLLAWNARRFLRNEYLLFLGVSCLFAAGFDLLHTLAYKGMGVFPDRGPNLPTQLWIAARGLQALSWAVAPWFLGRWINAGWLLAGQGVFAGLLLALILSGAFPICYQVGQGLTSFKIASEYAIMALLALGMLSLWRRRGDLDERVVWLLLAAMGLGIASEAAFTTYVSVYGPANLVGHLLKVLAFTFIYKALLETGLRRPYDLLFRDLKRSEEALRLSEETTRALLNAPHESALLVDSALRVQAVNQVAAERLGQGVGQVVGKNLAELIDAEAWHRRLPFLRQVFDEGRPSFLDDHRQGRVYAIAIYPVKDLEGRVDRVAIFAQDITERRQHEEERERLLAELTEALAQVKTLSGLLPICASCKRIRDDQGYWNQIEQYVSKHTEAQFSHGICPDCARRLYPQLYKSDQRTE